MDGWEEAGLGQPPEEAGRKTLSRRQGQFLYVCVCVCVQVSLSLLTTIHSTEVKHYFAQKQRDINATSTLYSCHKVAQGI